MSDLDILKQRSPEDAEFVEHWRSKYSKSFDLNSDSDQADFYEAICEMARHIANNADSSTVSVEVTTSGVSRLTVSATPKVVGDVS